MDLRDRDRLLMDSLAGGDHGAFWMLWDKHQHYLRNLCHRLLSGHPDDAEDALSETMVKAWEGLPDRATDIASLKAWLGRVAYHVCMDWWRRRGRTVNYSDALDDLGGFETSRVSDSPEEVVLGHETRSYLLSIVERLPPRLRDPIVLHALHEMSYADIALRLNITEASARKRMQQARDALTRLGEGSHPVPSAPRRIGRDEPSMPAGIGMGTLDDYLPPVAEPDATEIEFKSNGTDVVQVPLPSGATMDFHLDLECRSHRRQVRIETLRQYIERYPNGWRKRLELAHLLFSVGEWEQAIEQYVWVLKKRPRMLEIWVRIGKACRLMGDPGRAESIYEQAIAYAQQPATRLHLLGLTELCRQKPLLAALSLKEAAAQEPNNPAHWHALGSAYQEAGRPCEAVEAYDAALQRDPNDPVALVNSHEPLVTLGRMREAQKRVAQVVQLEPDCVLALKLLATHRCTGGLLEGRPGQRTHQLVRQALKLAPDSADVWETLANFHLRKGETEKGLAVLRQFVNQKPNSPQGWLYYSAGLFHAGRYEAAAGAILRADALYPRDLCIGRWACQVLPYAGKLDELRRVMEDLLSHYPSHWESHATAGLVSASWLAEYDRAYLLSRHATEQQPNLALAWLLHGEVLATSRRLREAVEVLEHALALVPEGDGYEQAIPAIFWLGQCYRDLGEEQKARSWFEEMASRCREWIPLDPTAAYYGLGCASGALGQTRETIRAYETALSHHLLYPEREAASEALEDLGAVKHG